MSGLRLSAIACKRSSATTMPAVSDSALKFSGARGSFDHHKPTDHPLIGEVPGLIDAGMADYFQRVLGQMKRTISGVRRGMIT